MLMLSSLLLQSKNCRIAMLHNNVEQHTENLKKQVD